MSGKKINSKNEKMYHDVTCKFSSLFLTFISFFWVLSNFHLLLGSLLKSLAYLGAYFFLPKKLKRFSRSLSLPSLLRMVTPPASPELGDMGGMVIARLRPRVPPGERSEDDRDDWIARIHELISAWRREWLSHIMTLRQEASSKTSFAKLTSSFAWNKNSFPSPSL